MKSNAFMVSGESFTPLNQKVVCVIHFRAGEKIPAVIGRGSDGDSIGVVFPNLAGQSWVSVVYTTRYFDFFAKDFAKKEEAQTWLKGMIFPLLGVAERNWVEDPSGILDGRIWVEVDSPETRSLALGEPKHLLDAKDFFAGAIQKLAQERGWIVRDGWIQFPF